MSSLSVSSLIKGCGGHKCQRQPAIGINATWQLLFLCKCMHPSLCLSLFPPQNTCFVIVLVVDACMGVRVVQFWGHSSCEVQGLAHIRCWAGSVEWAVKRSGSVKSHGGSLPPPLLFHPSVASALCFLQPLGGGHTGTVDWYAWLRSTKNKPLPVSPCKLKPLTADVPVAPASPSAGNYPRCYVHVGI